jgi:hypothetical protein
MPRNKFHLDGLGARYGIREQMMCYDGHLETLIVVTEPKPSRRELARTITSPQC